MVVMTVGDHQNRRHGKASQCGHASKVTNDGMAAACCNMFNMFTQEMLVLLYIKFYIVLYELCIYIYINYIILNNCLIKQPCTRQNKYRQNAVCKSTPKQNRSRLLFYNFWKPTMPKHSLHLSILSYPPWMGPAQVISCFEPLVDLTVFLNRPTDVPLLKQFVDIRVWVELSPHSWLVIYGYLL